MDNKIIKLKETKITKEIVNAYLGKNVITDFSQVPVPIRMSFVQETPKEFIKHRVVGKNKQGKEIEVPYIDHFYAERCLNFISNFNWGSERINSEVNQITKFGKKVYEAMVELKMWIYIGENRIERFIVSGHDMYDNPAITKADALQSAVSKANTKFARQLGIGSNVIAKETKAYDRVERYYVDMSTKEPTSKEIEAKEKYLGIKKMLKEGSVTPDIKEEALTYFKNDPRYETAVSNLLKEIE